MGEYFQSALESTFGKQIDVKVQSLPTKSQFAKMDSGNFEATISGWNADFADQISFLDCMTSTNGYNSGKWMKLLAKAENTLLVDQRLLLLRTRLHCQVSQ
ncbi:hypothetical protein [Lactobacillus crispatus]|uniref:hypothetical protein n=1 Tax=Lactobacillus crispatus TaxID=47770 RepID=UPI00355BBA37